MKGKFAKATFLLNLVSNYIIVLWNNLIINTNKNIFLRPIFSTLQILKLASKYGISLLFKFPPVSGTHTSPDIPTHNKLTFENKYLPSLAIRKEYICIHTVSSIHIFHHVYSHATILFMYHVWEECSLSRRMVHKTHMKSYLSTLNIG